MSIEIIDLELDGKSLGQTVIGNSTLGELLLSRLAPVAKMGRGTVRSDFFPSTAMVKLLTSFAPDVAVYDPEDDQVALFVMRGNSPGKALQLTPDIDSVVIRTSLDLSRLIKMLAVTAAPGGKSAAKAPADPVAVALCIAREEKRLLSEPEMKSLAEHLLLKIQQDELFAKVIYGHLVFAGLLGPAQDYEFALKHFIDAADANPEAQFFLGEMLADQGMEKDSEKLLDNAFKAGFIPGSSYYDQVILPYIKHKQAMEPKA